MADTRRASYHVPDGSDSAQRQQQVQALIDHCQSSWDFDRLLAEAQVVGVPGSGFGPSGEGSVRGTAFGSPAESVEAVERIATCLGR